MSSAPQQPFRGTRERAEKGLCTVLYVDYSFGFGGASKSLSLTLRGLEGVRARLFTSQWPEIIQQWFPGVPSRHFRPVVNYRARNWLRALVRRVGGGRIADWMALKSFAALDSATALVGFVRLLFILRRERVDIVHLNNGFAPPEAFWAARLLRVPVVVHARGFPDAVVRGRATRVIAVSDAVGRAMPEGVPRTSITTVHDPVDFEAIERASVHRAATRRALGLDNADVAVGIFGRVIPWKGQLEFVRAAILALRHVPELRAVIVGDESDGLRDYVQEIQRAIEESDQAARFILAGYRRDVEQVYAAMDVVVHASIEPEPFGMVVPEAMAAGRPVIASRAGGPLEIIEDEVDGLLVPPGDVERLAQSIVRLVRNPALRREMGQHGTHKAREHFGVARNAAGVAAVYAEILGTKSSGVNVRREAPVDGTVL